MKKSPCKEHAIIAGILFVLLAVSFYDVFFMGKTFKVGTANAHTVHYGVYGQEHNKPKFIPVNGTDAPVLEEPLYYFIRNSFKQGIIPFWNPHQACGYALIGLIQVGMFFPLHLILYLLPELFAWDILILVRFLLAGLFTYMFMRSMKFQKIPSLVSAIIFMLSGPMVLLQYWTVNVNILLPLLLIGIDLVIRKTHSRAIAFTSTIVALTVFAGHPEHIFFINVYGLLFFAFRFYTFRKKIRVKKVLMSLVVSYALGIALSSMVLFPFLQNLSTEFWHGHPPGVGLMNEEVRERALTLIVPHFFQRETLTYKFQFAGWWGGYLGILPVGLGFLSLWNNHKRGLNYFFALLGFLIVSKAYGLFYINWIGYLPIFNICRYAIHTPHLVAFSIAVAGGMGVRTLLLNKNIFNQALKFYCLPLLTVIAIHLIIKRSAPHFGISLKATAFTCGILFVFLGVLFLKEKRGLSKKIFSLLIILLISTELFLYIHRERPQRFHSFGDVPYIELLKNTPERVRSYGIFWAFYPNVATGFEVDDLGVFGGLIPKRFVHFVTNVINGKIFKNDLRPPALRAIPLTMGTPFLDMLNVRYIISPSTDMLSKILTQFEENEADRKEPFYSKEVNMYERPDAFPRAYIVHRVVFQPDQEKAFEILRQMQLHLREFVVIDQPSNPIIWEMIKGTPLQDESTATIVKYSPNEVLIKTDMKNPGFLVLSDAYHDDWKVFVNDKPTTLFLANNLVRSVFLPAGTFNIKFVFHPKSFYIGLKVSALALMILLMLWQWEFLSQNFSGRIQKLFKLMD